MNFSEKCYALLKTVPKGKVTTYKDVATSLGTKAYRAVGSAMNKNPHDTNKYPCHRVINSDGQVGGYAHGTEEKIKKLLSEGIIIDNNKIDLGKFGFNFK